MKPNGTTEHLHHHFLPPDSHIAFVMPCLHRIPWTTIHGSSVRYTKLRESREKEERERTEDVREEKGKRT